MDAPESLKIVPSDLDSNEKRLTETESNSSNHEQPNEPQSNTDESPRRNVSSTLSYSSILFYLFNYSFFIPDLAKKLGITDRLLTPLILLFMILGVIIGEFAPDQVQKAFDTAQLEGVSVRMPNYTFASLLVKQYNEQQLQSV